jgi:hypothetical protein
MSKERRKALARLSFTEKLKILEQLRAMSKEVAGLGLRKKPSHSKTPPSSDDQSSH